MPIVDYRCVQCDNRLEQFHHSRSQAPESISCDECGSLARQYFSMPGEYRPTNALRFDPIEIWVSNDDPTKSFPSPRTGTPPDSGYHLQTITSMHEALKYEKSCAHIIKAQREMEREMMKAMYEQNDKERRSEIAARVKGNYRAEVMFRKVCEWADRKKAKSPLRYGDLTPEVHFQVFSHDASNRQGYCSEETGWKERK